jgi:S-(hydroxymethyl)glutathione dehydrogenase/alcohol dehydrogenase
MKAAVLREIGKPLSIEDVTLADVGPREVRIANRAVGVCHSDLHFAEGAVPYPLPAVLGHEAAGIVLAVGSEVRSVKPGDHVVTCLSAFCGHCSHCVTGRLVNCNTGETLRPPEAPPRLSQGGEVIHQFVNLSSFAEESLVHENACVAISRDMPFDRAALIGCAVTTGVGAVINTAGVRAGETVAVIGCGGVGLSCIQGARLAKAGRIVAVDIDAAKLDHARRLGATDTVDSSATDAVEALKALVPEGLDYIFDAIGKIVTTEQAIAALGLGGAAVIVGLPPTGSTARFDPLVLAEANQRILGSNYGSVDPQRDIPALVDLYMDGELELDSLVSGRRPLEAAQDALDDLAAGGALRTLLVPSLAGGQ